MSRTTHSDLAKIILDHAERLKAVPAGHLVNDASTLEMLASAARILVAQDNRIDTMTVALRQVRALLPTQERAVLNDVLSMAAKNV